MANAEVEGWKAEVTRLRAEVEGLRRLAVPATEDEFAAELYAAAHKGLKTCWKWEDSGLDDEHPETRAYWCTVARNFIVSRQNR